MLENATSQGHEFTDRDYFVADVVAVGSWRLNFFFKNRYFSLSDEIYRYKYIIYCI